MPFLWVGQGTLIGIIEWERQEEREREKLRQGPHRSKEFAEIIAVSS